MKLYLLLEFPVSDSAPLRTQQLAHKAWLDPLVAAHGGQVRMALQADQLHGFGLDLEPPLHYYRPNELDTPSLTTQYVGYIAEQKARAEAGNPYPKDSPMMRISRAVALELVERGIDPETLVK